MNFKLRPLTWALHLATVSLISPWAWADDDTERKQPILPTIEVTAVEGITANPLEQKASDMLIKKEALQKRSATIGNALAGELGIHSNPFGGGSSSPVIRGQDGVRVKILQNGTDVIDMSALSPDHVVAADTLLANQVELVRGSSTLLYSTASPAGVVNVVDGRIPSQMPQGQIVPNVEGETLLRFNSNNDEKVATAGVTVGVGNHVALRFEGLKRAANDYHVSSFQSDELLDYLPDSDNKSSVGTFGASWIGEHGYVGASYSRREDQYGIPGHNHNYDMCRAHFIEEDGVLERGTAGRYYLSVYPHLMDDLDLKDEPHFHGCRPHDSSHAHSHATPFGFEHNHNHSGPWVEMKSDRYDVRGEWREPFKGLDKIKLSLTHADYYHDERDPGNPERPTRTGESSENDYGHAAAIFKNTGFNSRLEFYHTPTERLKGVFGVQYQTQKASALTPYLPAEGALPEARPRNLLVPHSNQGLSVFALESLKLGDVTLELAGRYERQKTPVHYNHELLAQELQRYNSDPHRPKTTDREAKHPDLTQFKQNAFSYSGTLLWDFKPNSRLSFTASHNERLPAPMELYYHGKHLATNSFEHGNKDLKKEQSNNFEIGIAHQGERVDYKASTYLSDFKNYIFNENVDKEGNLYVRRYNQTTAKFYGVEGELTYHATPNHRFTIFGDLVRGKLGELSPVQGAIKKDQVAVVELKDECIGYDAEQLNANIGVCTQLAANSLNQLPPVKIVADEECTADDFESDSSCFLVYAADLPPEVLKRPASNAPRVPPARLGFRYQGEFGSNWSANVEYSHVFPQNRIAVSTIPIRPSVYRNDDGEYCPYNDAYECTDEGYKKLAYGHENNDKKIYARHVYEERTKGYNLLNLGVDYRKTFGNMDYTFSLNANNVLNEKVYIHNSFLPFVPQMGRNFVFAVNAKF
ncbi:MAG: TonB-dependent receptor [Acinetobacter sp.]|nr:TonB-dependent receptor [Acinetobacter sp.]